MPKLLSSRALSLALLLLPLSALRAQNGNHLNNQPTPAQLKATLLQRGDEFMAFWKAHNTPGLTSLLAPGFTTVSSDGVSTGVDANMHGLMQCNVTGYRITQSSLIGLSPAAAILITRQEQNISCAGHPLPPVMLMTDTYVLRNNQWLLLLHTEAPPEQH